MLDLEPIKLRLQKTTAGPWCWENWGQGVSCPSGWLCSLADRDRKSDVPFASEKDDGEFIAHAREDIPALIAEVEHLEIFEVATWRLQMENQELIEERNAAESEVERLRAELTTLLQTAQMSSLPGCQRCARKIKSVLGDNSE